MKFEKNTIYSLKFNSGEEVIAKVTGTEFGTITVTKPLAMAATPQGLQMIPAMFTFDPHKTVVININSVSMSSEARSDVQTAYLEATTGLTVGSNQILKG